MRALRLAAVLLCLALAGCPEFEVTRIQNGMSSAQVRALVGAPTEERTLPDGSKAWYYVFGYSGFTTYRVRFDAGDRVIESRQVLTDADFHKYLIAGQTTRDDALREFGRPGVVNIFPNLNEVVWTYRWRDQTLEMLAELHFETSTGKLKYYSLYRDPIFASGPVM